MATTYEGSKQQKYYNKNKDELLAKKRAKTAADKAQKMQLKLWKKILNKIIYSK